MRIDESWKTVTEKEFDQELDKYDYLESNIVLVLEPPVTFYWNRRAKSREDRSFGNGSFARIIRDYDPKTGQSLPPEFQLKIQEDKQ